MDIFEFPDVIPPEHSEFLLNDDSLLTQHKYQISYLRNQYAQEEAALWGKCTILKDWLKRSENYWGVHYASMENPVTKKAYGMEAGKAFARSSPEYQDLHKLWVQTEVRRRQISGYMDSLDNKAGFIPGAQGRANRTLKLEEYDE